MCKECEKYKRIAVKEIQKREEMEKKLRDFFWWIREDILKIEEAN